MKNNKNPRIENEEIIIPLIDYVEDVNYSLQMLFEDFRDVLKTQNYTEEEITKAALEVFNKGV